MVKCGYNDFLSLFGVRIVYPHDDYVLESNLNNQYPTIKERSQLKTTRTALQFQTDFVTVQST